MDDFSLTNIDAKESFLNIDLIPAFIKQLEKDFSSVGRPVTLNGDKRGEDLYREIHREISLVVLDYLNVDQSGLMQLLYRIDVNEHLVQRETALKTDRSANDVIADLIIRREWQKVLIRRFYR